jgi:hypothetical protein
MSLILWKLSRSHTLNAPGKFLIAAIGYETPKRARACLITN